MLPRNIGWTFFSEQVLCGLGERFRKTSCLRRVEPAGRFFVQSIEGLTVRARH